MQNEQTSDQTQDAAGRARLGSSKKTLGLRPNGSFRRAGALHLASQLDELCHHDSGVRRGDVDAVHDQRAATRRLRAALGLFDRAYGRGQLRELDRPLRRLDRRLGEVRDTDVMLKEVRSASRDLDDAELNGFIARLEEHRAAARVVLLQYLDGDTHRRWLARFRRVLEGDAGDQEAIDDDQTEAEPEPASSGRIEPARVRDVLPALLWNRYGRVSAYQPAVPGASSETLHALRKDGRRLRYSLEAFRELFGDELAPLLQPLRQMQDALGTMHDAQELVSLLTEFERQSGPSDRVQPLIVEERGRALESRAEFERVWQEIVADSFRGRLSALVASL